MNLFDVLDMEINEKEKDELERELYRGAGEYGTFKEFIQELLSDAFLRGREVVNETYS